MSDNGPSATSPIAGKADEMPEQIQTALMIARNWKHTDEERAIRWLADDRERLLALSTWQSIETAPKDGTRILCAISLSDGWGMAVLHWSPIEYWSDGYDTVVEAYVRHWMPLPAPPTEDTNAIR